MSRAGPQIHFFGGTNEVLVKTEAQELADKLVAQKDREFGLEIINGHAANTTEGLAIIHRLRDAINTLPFLGGTKVVWLKNTNLFGDFKFAKESAALTEAAGELAAELKRGLPRGVTLLVSATELDKRRALYKVVEKNPGTKLFDLPDLERGGYEQREKMGGFISDLLRQKGKTIGDGALEMFIDLVGANSQACAHETEKLALYIGDRKEITEADVEAVVSSTNTVNIWKLMDAVAERDAPGAMRALDNLLAQRESVIGILMLTAAQVRLMLLAKDLVDRKLVRPKTDRSAGLDFKFQLDKLSPEETAHLRDKSGNLPNAWRFHRCAVAALKFSPRELIAAMNTLLEANRTIVTTQVDDRIVLEEAIAKIIVGRRRAGKPRHAGVEA